MSQITIYLDPAREKRLRSVVKGAQVSLSKWLGRLIDRELSEEWPESIKNLAGAWDDFPSLDQIRKHQGKDTKREKL